MLWGIFQNTRVGKGLGFLGRVSLSPGHTVKFPGMFLKPMDAWVLPLETVIQWMELGAQ